MNVNELFPPTNDERAPKRLSIVFHPDVIPPWLSNPGAPSSKVGQRSLYQPKSQKFRERQNSAPSGQKGEM